MVLDAAFMQKSGGGLQHQILSFEPGMLEPP